MTTMRLLTKVLPEILAAISALAWRGTASAAAPVCGDFLALIAQKPPHLQFEGCKPDLDAQVRVLRAHYRVKGVFAASVERFFVKNSKMQALRFNCCIWETVPNKRGNRYGRFGSHYQFDYEIDMGSGETLFSQRRDWVKIDWFAVTVSLPLESP